MSNSETVELYTFFEASRFGCRKTIFDATKVTCNMYSCAISGMSREIMKMDGRDSAECQNWEKRDKISIIEKFKSLNDKKLNSVLLLNSKEAKKVNWNQ